MGVIVETEFHCDGCGRFERVRYGPKPATDHIRARGWRVGKRVACPPCVGKEGSDG